jgi:LTXXQ motif family protein
MRKIGAYAAIGALVAVIFSPPPIAAFGLRVGPLSLGLPLSFGHRHRIARHPDVPAGAVLYDSAEAGIASAQGLPSVLLYPELALPAVYEYIFSSTPSLRWPFGYYSIFRVAFAKTNQDQHPCQQVVRGTAIVERIGREISATAAQRPLLQKLGGALGMASGFLTKLCPKEIPRQPVARLQLMETQIEELTMALDIIAQPLQEFEQSLSRSQQTRFAAAVSTPTAAAHSNRSENIAPACGATQAAVDWSIEQIDESVQPSDAERDALADIRQAFGRAASDLDEHCPMSLPRTALGRLELTEARLDAAWQAMLSIEAALTNFETRLSDEQRVRLDAMNFAAAQ